ncbi:uncharacterized protein LOC126199568 [Schistocerca nitens]|uniref:uncharacterized protein LOC126199568 n=1 Tax=Schistocerca nitens TaxID=7011 RepID=UPI0021175CBA|nr:uncharacterized protein LOC126199568 [Schistocerca nitens]
MGDGDGGSSGVTAASLPIGSGTAEEHGGGDGGGQRWGRGSAPPVPASPAQRSLALVLLVPEPLATALTAPVPPAPTSQAPAPALPALVLPAPQVPPAHLAPPALVLLVSEFHALPVSMHLAPPVSAPWVPPARVLQAPPGSSGASCSSTTSTGITYSGTALSSTAHISVAHTIQPPQASTTPVSPGLAPAALALSMLLECVPLAHQPKDCMLLVYSTFSSFGPALVHPSPLFLSSS